MIDLVSVTTNTTSYDENLHGITGIITFWNWSCFISFWIWSRFCRRMIIFNYVSSEKVTWRDSIYKYSVIMSFNVQPQWDTHVFVCIFTHLPLLYLLYSIFFRLQLSFLMKFQWNWARECFWTVRVWTCCSWLSCTCITCVAFKLQHDSELLLSWVRVDTVSTSMDALASNMHPTPPALM